MSNNNTIVHNDNTDVIISDRDVFRMLDRIKNDVDGKILLRAMTIGGILLRDATKDRLYKKFPRAATAVGREKDNITMLEGVRVSKEKTGDAVNVYILGNFMNRWFELGTDNRYLIRGHQYVRRGFQRHGKYRDFKREEYRGKITPLHFFREARNENMGKVHDKIIEVVEREIKKIMDD